MVRRRGSEGRKARGYERGEHRRTSFLFRDAFGCGRLLRRPWLRQKVGKLAEQILVAVEQLRHLRFHLRGGVRVWGIGHAVSGMLWVESELHGGVGVE